MRSDFLVHWTGKDIGLDRKALTDGARKHYVDRLVETLNNGLWMTVPSERIQGNADAWIHYESPMTCFTEIRLSQSQSHSSRYGLLGIGVTRKFVLDRFGGPVHYVRNNSCECIVGNTLAILSTLKELGCEEVENYFAVNTAFIKNMSNHNQDDFTYLDEQEWRIVHTIKQTSDKRILHTGIPRPAFRIPFEPGDVKIIVFPDEQTRSKARSDSQFGAWLLSSLPSDPILLTIEECGHF